MNEKTNTWRSLQDLPPAVTSFWCRFNWHNWEKWSDKVIHKDGSYTYWNQDRKCTDCNRSEIRTIKRI